MKFLLLSIILLITISCNNNRTIGDKDIDITNKENLLDSNNIDHIVLFNHNKIKNIKGDYLSFREYIKNLDNKYISSIPLALDYINTCISPNIKYQDSIFIDFNNKFYFVANNLSDTFESKYPKIIAQLNKNQKNKNTKTFLDNIKTCGMELYNSEGMYYFDVQYDYFYNNFKNRVSPSCKEFLFIRQNELKQGFSEDAGLQISFDEVYQRVKKWELFLNKYRTTYYGSEGSYYYQTYLETLLTGMDNSRVFDFQENKLSPEVKSLYEKIISETPATESNKIVSQYYALLSRHNFAENDSIDIFLKLNGLSTMLGVQPHNR